jgi:hypothetical protein
LIFIIDKKIFFNNIFNFENCIPGIVRLQDFFKEAQVRNWKIKLYQFPAGIPYRDTFWKIKREEEYNIVLDVKKENIYTVLKQV